jgi:hypothetical protein
VRKRDATEAAITRVLRQIGADYVMLDPFDLLVLFRGRLIMLDCKTKEGRPTALQKDLIARGWPLRFVITEEDTLAALGVGRG